MPVLSHLPVLKVAVVGHTNTGKTSLLRTLTKDVDFGDVSNRPSTTRHVEGTALLVDGKPLIELYDTPGLEDSMGLLEHLETLRDRRDTDWILIIKHFLESAAARDAFEQEAKVLRQVLASDVALYVIDARERMLAKYRDELSILSYCARPVVPVLNFVVSSDAKTVQWREHLARLNLHAVVEFDTVVLSEQGEQRLFEKMQTLLDPFHATLAAVIADRAKQRANLIRASADLVADLLIDVAAYVVVVPVELPKTAREEAIKTIQQAVRTREQQCVTALLALYRFRKEDYAADALPITDGQWGLDLFNPEALKHFGIRTGSAAAAGGAAGLAIDAMTGGLSLGTATLLGAAIGAIWSGSQTHGKRIADRMRGFTELRVHEATVRLLAARQSALVRALLQRGHASQTQIRLSGGSKPKKDPWQAQKWPTELQQAKAHPHWSRLNHTDVVKIGLDSQRLVVKDRLARLLETRLTDSARDSCVSPN